MSTKIILSSGSAVAVYDDRFRPLLEALGDNLEIIRQTEVEFDETDQKWYAKHISTGLIISRNKLRSVVIEDEVAWLEGRLHVAHC